jgi:GTPase SAR1 family protein
LIVCGELTQSNGIDSINKWIERIDSLGGEEVPRVIVGNKFDSFGRIDKKKRVLREWGVRDVIGRYPDFKYFEVSAITNTNVDEMFSYAAHLAVETIRIDTFLDSINLSAKSQQKETSTTICC